MHGVNCLDRRERGFSFLEIIIGTLVMIVGISAVMAMVLWGRQVLKQSENKAAAMNVAFSKMEEYLAKSYSRLGTLEGRSPDADPDTIEQIDLMPGTEGVIFKEAATTESGFDWQVEVSLRYEGNDERLPDPPAGHAYTVIPYKQIEVRVFYREESPMRQGLLRDKSVRLVNFVPYPFLHARQVVLGPDRTAVVPANAYGSIRSDDTDKLKITDGLKITLDYETPKDVLIIYNIALRIDDAAGLVNEIGGAVPTIFTGCFVDDQPGDPAPVETRTPIFSQPLISNAVALTEERSLTPGEHTIEIKWYKDTTAGRISLRNANLIIIATEKKET